MSGRGRSHKLATEERLALEAIGTRADRIVLHHLANGIAATRSRAGIHTAFVLAGQMILTLIVVGALGATAGRTSNVVGLARAGGLLSDLTANRVGSTG